MIHTNKIKQLFVWLPHSRAPKPGVVLYKSEKKILYGPILETNTYTFFLLHAPVMPAFKNTLRVYVTFQITFTQFITHAIFLTYSGLSVGRFLSG